MSKHYTFQELIELTRTSISEFAKVEQRPWGVEAAMMELSKQVGDLAKHVMVQEKYYLKKREDDPNYRTTVGNIADELADIIFAVVRIADYYDIDLEKAQLKARKEELESLGKKVESS